MAAHEQNRSLTLLMVVALATLGAAETSVAWPHGPGAPASPAAESESAEECPPPEPTWCTEQILKRVQADLDRPGLEIDSVRWIGKGEYELRCATGRYAVEPAVSLGEDPGDPPDIKNWTMGGGTAEEPGTYVLDTTLDTHSVKVYEPTPENLAYFGASLPTAGTKATFFRESVQAVYEYGDDYFDKWVLREKPAKQGGPGGVRIETHPIAHHFTLTECSPEDGPSYFILGRVDDEGNLELGAIRLKVGVTILVPANTVHTNDYVKGTLEEVYPLAFGLNEVRLMNTEGKRVRLVPEGGKPTCSGP